LIKKIVFDKKIDINDNVFQKERRSVSINKLVNIKKSNFGVRR